MRSLPDVPRLQDPGLYELLQAMRREVVDLSSRVESVESGAGAGFTSGATPPQFDDTDKLATTHWVNKVGKQYASYQSLAVNTVLTAAYAGGLVQFGGGVGRTFTLPLAATMKPGSTITFWAGGSVGGSIVAQGSDVFYRGNAGPETSVDVTAGDTAEFMAFGAAGWIVVEGSLHSWPTPAQFANNDKLATTSFVQRASGNRANLIGVAGSLTLTAAHAGFFLVAPQNGSTLTLPLSSTVAPGTEIAFAAGAGGGFVKPQGAEVIQLVPNSTTVTMGPSDTLAVVSVAGGWYARSGSVMLPISGVMAGSNWAVAPQFDNSGKLATTSWVKRFGKQYSSYIGINAATTLNVAYAGAVLLPVSAVPITLPLASTFPNGTTISFVAFAPGASVLRQGSDLIFIGNTNVASLPLQHGDTLELVSDGGTAWVASGGSTPLPYSVGFSNYVRAHMGGFANVIGLNVPNTLTLANLGNYVIVFGAAGNLTFPLSNTCAPGDAFLIQATGAAITFVRQGSDVFNNPPVGNVTSFTLAAGKSVWAISGGTGNAWYLTGPGI